METDIYKEVRFDKYCEHCASCGTDESLLESPCYDCLQEPTALYSHKPINFKGKAGYEDYVAPSGL